MGKAIQYLKFNKSGFRRTKGFPKFGGPFVFLWHCNRPCQFLILQGRCLLNSECTMFALAFVSLQKYPLGHTEAYTKAAVFVFDASCSAISDTTGNNHLNYNKTKLNDNTLYL